MRETLYDIFILITILVFIQILITVAVATQHLFFNLIRLNTDTYFFLP